MSELDRICFHRLLLPVFNIRTFRMNDDFTTDTHPSHWNVCLSLSSASDWIGGHELGGGGVFACWAQRGGCVGSVQTCMPLCVWLEREGGRMRDAQWASSRDNQWLPKELPPRWNIDSLVLAKSQNSELLPVALYKEKEGKGCKCQLAGGDVVVFN